LIKRKITFDDVEVVARGLEVPWSIDFTPDKRLLFTERAGRMSAIVDDEIKLMLELDVEARPGDEGGLLGIAVDPNFVDTSSIFAYYTYRNVEDRVLNRVSRFVEKGGKLLDEKIILDDIPGGRVHDGGRIKFGPDGKLYVTTGETWHRDLAQDLNSLGGKILRLNRDGSMPKDNPFPNSPIYSYGNRNPQGLAWHPVTNALYSTEHGPSGENGWYAHDEINLIEPGKNYGWPSVIGEGDDLRYTNPLYHTGNETWAPSGCTFYSGDLYPDWKNALFVANLRGEHLRIIKFRPPDYTRIDSNMALLDGELGRLRDVVQGRDGYLYICTSNRDGRGSPREDDDIIGRIRP